MYLYPVGRGVKRLTRDQFLRLSTVNRLDPEVIRRDMAMMEAAQDAGVFLSFSNGWRDGSFAESEWERRYTPTTQTARVKPTDKKYEGVWYSLNPGEIGCATPWNGLHTYGKPGTAGEYEPLPQSTDWYGDLKWMQANCSRFGLRHFKHVPGEGHHTQPVEGCTSRAEYKPTKHKLGVWPIPKKGREMQLVAAVGDVNVFSLAADRVAWAHGDTYICLAGSGLCGPQVALYRPAFKQFHATGPLPAGWVPADFASYEP